MTSFPSKLTRRSVLVGLGASAALAACGGGEAATTGPTPTPTSTTEPPPAQEDVIGRALEAVGIDAPVRLTPILFAPEVLTGPGAALQFGLVDVDQEAQPNLDLDVWFVGADGAVAAGPFQPTFYPNERIPFTGGIYHAEVEIPEPGTYDLIIATRDQSVAGAGAVQAVAPAQSLVVAPGATMPAVVTPTVDDPQDLEALCTREPDCNMHETSLAEALGTGRPIVLTVATPAYCSTALCGPVVDDVMSVFDAMHEEYHARYGDHEDGVQFLDGPIFIHAEVFKDAGNTPAPIVTELGLPSEPWTWLVGGDGVVLDRWGGPVVPEVLRARLDELCPDLTCIDAPAGDASEGAGEGSSEG